MSAPRREPRRDVDGVLLLDKPQGRSSNSALQHARRLFNAAKAGHTGTLDPMATGLLPICFGEATKFSSELLDADKRYLATVALGVSTDSGDADGRVISERPISCNANDIESVGREFLGEIEQVPPMFSALKRDGKPLYEYARAGIELERPARTVCIHDLTIISVSGSSFEMSIHCSKGTYIRSLAIDMGERLGCGAHLSDLRRTAIGRFDLENAVTLAALEEMSLSALDTLLCPVDHLVAGLPAVTLNCQDAARMANGQRLPADYGMQVEGYVRIFGADRGFMGVGRYLGGVIHPTRLVSSKSGG